MNEKKVTVITIVCLIFIILAGGGAIYYLQFEVLAVKEEELAQLKERVRVDTDKKNKIPELERRIKQVDAELKVEQLKIPDLTRAEYDELAVKLDGFRSRAGVTVDRGSWTTPKAPIPMQGRPGRLPQIPPGVHKVEYDLAVSGSFFQLLRYINLLEQERRFINVESFSISPGQAAPVAAPGTPGAQARPLAPRRDLKITVYTYTYRPQPKPFEIDAFEERPSLTTELPPD
jgi:Tfp pilus assembly protein PilO